MFEPKLSITKQEVDVLISLINAKHEEILPNTVNGVGKEAIEAQKVVDGLNALSKKLSDLRQKLMHW